MVLGAARLAAAELRTSLGYIFYMEGLRDKSQHQGRLTASMQIDPLL